MSNNDLSSRLARWALSLQRFRFKIEHRKGSLNVVPDVLSRVNDSEIASIEQRPEVKIDLESEFFKTKEYRELIERIEANQSKFPDLKTEAGYVYRRAEHSTGQLVHDDHAWKLWVPKELVKDVLYKAHDDPLSSHGGIHKTLQGIRQFYFWPGLVPDVKAYVNACDICKCKC